MSGGSQPTTPAPGDKSSPRAPALRGIYPHTDTWLKQNQSLYSILWFIWGLAVFLGYLVSCVRATLLDQSFKWTRPVGHRLCRRHRKKATTFQQLNLCSDNFISIISSFDGKPMPLTWKGFLYVCTLVCACAFLCILVWNSIGISKIILFFPLSLSLPSCSGDPILSVLCGWHFSFCILFIVICLHDYIEFFLKKKPWLLLGIKASLLKFIFFFSERDPTQGFAQASERSCIRILIVLNIYSWVIAKHLTLMWFSSASLAAHGLQVSVSLIGSFFPYSNSFRMESNKSPIKGQILPVMVRGKGFRV